MLLNYIINQKYKLPLTTFVNPYSYLFLRKSEIFSKFNIEIDGILLVTILNFFRLGNFTRASFDMTSLAGKIFNAASEKGEGVYIVGSKKEEIEKAVENIRNKFSNLQIIGFNHGYLSDEARKVLIENIIESRCQIVICGMGVIKQEQFLFDLYRNGWTGVGYTCGGFIHQTAKQLNYYPDWVDKFNLRWLYRLLDEPKLAYRYFVVYPYSILILVLDIMRYKYRKFIQK